VDGRSWLWLSPKQRRTFHQPRLRRESYGELVQIDGSEDVLCHREQRHVGEQLTLASDRKQLILDRSGVSDELSGQYVDLYDFPNGRLEVRWKGRVLPYRTFHKDQRVNAAAIVENKRLGHALSLIKAQQDRRLAPKVQTNSEKNGYMKRPARCVTIVATPIAVEMMG
jgi:hypothetical protein